MDMKLDAVPFRWLFAFALLLALAACGGGGGGGGSGEIRTISPGGAALQGTWLRTITFQGGTVGATSTQLTVTAADVPTESEAGAFTTSTAAALQAGRFPNKTVTPNGSTLSVTDPDTGFTVQVHGLSITNYVGCGSCAVGTAVTLTITADLTEGGLFDGTTFTTVRHNVVLTLRYERVS
jgi:hypothetical protein